ncbi:hypothetical protein [Bacillus sp. RAR_GA_16]|uniref:hypothetical protein n=1 Tax=Bacillus sp. RAR_GA_16 TaxID=2876774 RepID=UPI001CCE32B6|nr:hypothetical protein [Bacillus sp. RAR_GA_16]MCA0173974.1 hypothetical protein [Bacillus sp. RAR_GA_16]
MDTKKLDLMILLTMTIAVPVCTILPSLGIFPDAILYFVLPVGIIFCLIGVMASVMRIRRSGWKQS